MNTGNQMATAIPAEGLSEEIRAAWRRLPDKGFFFVLLAAWLGLFHFLGNSTFGYVDTPSLFGWMFDAYSKAGLDGVDGAGMLVLPLIFLIVWQKRQELLAVSFGFWWPGGLLLAAGLGLHLLGYVVQQPRLSIAGLFGGIYGLMGLVWGTQWLRAIFFPYCLTVMMMPLGSLTERVTFPLQVFVSWTVEHCFNDILGIGVLRVGTQLFNSLGTYKFEVAAACSGIRSLSTILLIGIFFTYYFSRVTSTWQRALLIGSTIPLAIIANLIRLSLIIGTGEFFGQATGDYVHESGFWSVVPYVVAIAGILFVNDWLERRPEKSPSLSPTPVHP